jgi:hypothetical protein
LGQSDQGEHTHDEEDRRTDDNDEKADPADHLLLPICETATTKRTAPARTARPRMAMTTARAIPALLQRVRGPLGPGDGHARGPVCHSDPGG